jgi:hypothetical protein
MDDKYQDLFDFIASIKAVNTHSHHYEDARFHGFDLTCILENSYVSWCGQKFDKSKESRDYYLQKVRYKYYFRAMQKSLMEIYDFQEEFTSDNWNGYDAIVARKYLDPNWHLSICKMAADLNVPIQCHTGMGCLKNTRAINMLELIRDNPHTKFSGMHASFPWCEDILAYLDMFPNVYADVVWLPLLSPTAAEYVINHLIEVGTSERIVWGCDTWTSEESCGARLAMNEVLSRVLENKIHKGYFRKKDALLMAQNIMHDNAKELFNI